MAALGYFKSPTTGNAVTWDGSGAQTDTGIAHGAYRMPTQVSLGDGPQDPGRMYRGGSATFNENGGVQLNGNPQGVSLNNAGGFNMNDFERGSQLAGGGVDGPHSSGQMPSQPAPPGGVYQQTYGGVQGGGASGGPAPNPSANNYFISPSTGNMVTWDATGKQTDTGQKPGNGTGYSSMTPAMGDSNKSFIDAQANPGTNRYATSTNGTSGSNNVILSDSNGINGVWGNQAKYDANVAANKAAGSTALPNPATGGGATGGGATGGAAQSAYSPQQLQQQISGLRTQGDLNKFFATSGYTAEQLAHAAPQYGGVSDYQNAMAKGAQTYSAGQNGGGATGGAGSSGGIIGTGAPAQQAAGTPGSSGNTLQSSSSSTNAGTGPGTWTVSPDQTVEGRIGGIINSNSPLMQQARTRALEQKNEHGLANSSMAITAGDSAVYDAAQRIAQPDAGMFGDAARTNAMAQTSYGISQNNNQTNRDINSANIGAQKELQHSSQLYNNLATQTASANSIQGWGLNTITTIQSSDLSAAAKDKAISSVRQYLADSYKIQGDWHTTAAKTIDAIFK